MKLLTKEIRDQLLRNGRSRENGYADERGEDFPPVVKLFTPDGGCTWLLSELDPEEPDIAFGLCDLGMGFPELGYVSLAELKSVRGKLNLPIERDRHFTAAHPLSVYADAARADRGITEDPGKLDAAAAAQDGGVF
jgi:hypothetical protein